MHIFITYQHNIYNASECLKHLETWTVQKHTITRRLENGNVETCTILGTEVVETWRGNFLEIQKTNVVW
jgi:hypothetical protein